MFRFKIVVGLSVFAVFRFYKITIVQQVPPETGNRCPERRASGGTSNQAAMAVRPPQEILCNQNRLD